MKLEVLAAAVEKNGRELADHMNLQGDAVIVNQCGDYSYEEFSHGNGKIRVFPWPSAEWGLAETRRFFTPGGISSFFPMRISGFTRAMRSRCYPHLRRIRCGSDYF